MFFYFNVLELKLSISLVAGLCSFLLLRDITIKNATGRYWESLTGSISGFLTGSVVMPWPPVILAKKHFRATSAFYFILVFIIRIDFSTFPWLFMNPTVRGRQTLPPALLP